MSASVSCVYLQVLWPRKGAFDNANDLKEQAFYRFIAKTYWGHIGLQFALLYALGGMQWFVWLGCVRVGSIDLQMPAVQPPVQMPAVPLLFIVAYCISMQCHDHAVVQGVSHFHISLALVHCSLFGLTL